MLCRNLIFRIFSLFIICSSLCSCSYFFGKEDIKPLKKIKIDNQPVVVSDGQYSEGWPEASWWKKYNNSELNALVSRALRNSPSIALVRSRLVTALANVKTVAPSNNLNIDAVANAEVTYPTENGVVTLPHSDWRASYSLGLNATYQINLWGSAKGQLDAANYAAKAQDASLENAKIILAASVTQNYFLMQLYMQQSSIIEDEITLQQQNVNNCKILLKQGLLNNEQLVNENNTLSSLKKQLSVVQNSVNTQQHILVSLLGGESYFIKNLEMQPVPDVRVEAPSKLDYSLLSRRSDLQAQRWLVESSLGTVRVAKAALYPSFQISAFAGLMSVPFNKLLSLSSQQYSIKPMLVLPIFNMGQLKATHLVAKAKENEAVANYNQAVVDAVKDVLIAISNLNSTNNQITLASEEFKSRQEILSEYKLKLKQGLVDSASVNRIEIAELNQKMNLLNLIFQRIIDDVTLIKALGGGYFYNGDVIEKATVKNKKNKKLEITNKAKAKTKTKKNENNSDSDNDDSETWWKSK